MTSVSSIGTNIFGAVTKAKPVKWACEQFRKNPEGAIVYSTIGSIVVKDGIGCATYVSQSMNNKEIPKERRNFVAAQDLTNGVLMITAQIALFLAAHRLNKPIFEKLAKKSFGPEVRQKIVETVQKAQAKAGKTPSKAIAIETKFDKIKQNSFHTFEYLTDLVASTILAKRVIVPLIATPLASKLENKMNAKSEENTQAVEA